MGNNPTDPRRNFLWMGICFSISHACCTTPIIYATSLLGDRIGDVGNGIMYIMNIVCSMVISVLVVHKISLKGGLLLCLLCFALYEGSFTIALVLNGKNKFWLFSVIGSLCGGLAFGIGWVAQGGYLSRSATLVAEHEGVAREVATSELASGFAFWYLIFEVAAKLVFSLLMLANIAPFTIGVIYFIVAVIAFGMMTRVNSIAMDSKAVSNTTFTKSINCVLLWQNPHIWLLSAMNLTFGFSAALMNGHVNSHFVRKKSVGFLTAITCLFAALLTLCHRPLSRLYGKGVCLAVGSASFLAIAVVLIVATDSRQWGWEILVLYFLQGSGRAVYESINKAIFADVFTAEDTEGAFANCFLQQAISSAICFFFLAGELRSMVINIILLVLASSIVPLYAISFFQRQNIPEQAPLVSKTM